MYSEKVQRFISNYITYWDKVVIDTMGVEYKISQHEKVSIIRFINNDVENLYEILDKIKNSAIIFDSILFWFDSDYAGAEKLFTDLSEIAKKNNLIIFT